MTIALTARLRRLVGRTRNRLWLEDLARLLRRALWVCALSLALGAFGRWWLGMAEPVTITVIATLPALAALLMIAGRRPSLDTAVATADRRAGADSLLLSAWGLLQRAGPRPAAGAVVLARADRCLRGWEAGLGSPGLGGYAHRLWLPLLATCAALPLLGLEQRHASFELADPESVAIEVASDDGREASLATLVGELRGLAPLGASSGPDHKESGPGAPGLEATPGDSGADGEVRVPAPKADAGPGSGIGDTAGTGAAGNAQPSSTRAAPAVPEHLIDLPRHGEVSGLSSGFGANLAPARDNPADPGDGAAPPAELPARIQRDGMPLDPGRRVLADRYFALSPE